MARWFEEGNEPEESNPVENLKQVVNNPPNSLPIDGDARRLYYLGEWVKSKQNKINRPMTINEYKKKFLELYEQLKQEHGEVKYVHIEKDDILQPFPPTIITIEF